MTQWLHFLLFLTQLLHKIQILCLITQKMVVTFVGSKASFLLKDGTLNLYSIFLTQYNNKTILKENKIRRLPNRNDIYYKIFHTNYNLVWLSIKFPLKKF